MFLVFCRRGICLIVDFHNHFYPKAYIDELKRVKGYASFSKDEKGRLLIQYAGDYNIVVGPHVNLGDRIKAMNKHEIDLQGAYSNDAQRGARGSDERYKISSSGERWFRRDS